MAKFSSKITGFLHKGIKPDYVPSLPWFPLRQYLVHPMVESAEHPLHMRGQDPCFWPVYQDRLYHHQVDLSQFLGIRSLPSQYPSQPRPLLTGAQEVAYHFRKVIVLCRKKSPQVLEGGDLGEGESHFMTLSAIVRKV